ncbi:MAG: hypothetical protein IPM55_22950 [Acidobacteria bacterium]|nr:hypothetical protein [Acidobacteriota bacterium]
MLKRIDNAVYLPQDEVAGKFKGGVRLRAWRTTASIMHFDQYNRDPILAMGDRKVRSGQMRHHRRQDPVPLTLMVQ